MSAPQDMYNAVRRYVKPPLHRVFDWTFGGYAMTSNTEEEYVGTVDLTESEFENLLAAAGFKRNLVSSLKVRVDGNVSNGSWAWRESPLADKQLHVILHNVDDHIEVYAHWEPSWLTHPYKHYRARECHPEIGVEMTREFLRRYESETHPNGVPFEVESFYWRTPWYLTLVHNTSEDLTKWTSGIKRRVSAWRYSQG